MRKINNHGNTRKRTEGMLGRTNFPCNSVTFRGFKNGLVFCLCRSAAWPDNSENIPIQGVDISPRYASLTVIHPHGDPRTQIRGLMAPRGLKPAGFFFQRNFGESS